MPFRKVGKNRRVVRDGYRAAGCERPLSRAVTDFFKARWTADIHKEGMQALLKNEPHRDRDVARAKT